MQKSLVALLSLVLLSGCGTTTSLTGTPVASRTLAVREAGKPVVDPPRPVAPRQGFTKADVTSIATEAYAQAFAAKTPVEAHKIAGNALEKIAALKPKSKLANDVIPYALAVLKTEVKEAESDRRLALWPLLYISKGLDDAETPVFFEMAAKVMESMVNWKDGLAVGLVTLDVLQQSDNGYVKTMAAKAFVAFKSPRLEAQDGYKNTLATLKEIGETFAALALKK
ncbi:MAG: hypothetical protein JWM80_4121 [Cyanobacteria bacterium RYN_339]|nr:hypothetical protein [Cyanobacteria bacterium RYN_339]